MPTLNQIVSGLAIEAGKPFDVPFKNYLKMIVRNWTVTLTKRTLERKPLDRRYLFSSIVMPISRVDAISCPISYGCRYRTVSQVPSLIRVNNIIFDFVGNPDFTQAYGQIQDWQRLYKKYNKYTSHEVDYIYKDGYIFLDGDKIEANQAYIGVQAVFSNYNDLKPFNCNTDCNYDDLPYPILSDLLEDVLQAIYTNELRAYIPSSSGEVHMDADNKESGNAGNK